MRYDAKTVLKIIRNTCVRICIRTQNTFKTYLFFIKSDYDCLRVTIHIEYVGQNVCLMENVIFKRAISVSQTRDMANLRSARTNFVLLVLISVWPDPDIIKFQTYYLCLYVGLCFPRPFYTKYDHVKYRNLKICLSPLKIKKKKPTYQTHR